MKMIGSGLVALMLLGAAAAPVVAQPKAEQSVTRVRVFEGPS